MAAEVFISYSSQDQERVVKIADKLRSAGVSIWVDESGIGAATLWSKEIATAIKSCRVLVLMVTPNSVKSKNVVKEVSLAAEQNKQILPVILEPTQIPEALEYHLAGIQHLDIAGMSDSESAEEILAALERLLGLEGEEASAAGHGVRGSRRRSSNIWADWRVCACVILAVAIGWLIKPVPEVRQHEPSLPPRQVKATLNSTNSVNIFSGNAFDLSPDGRNLVYRTTGAEKKLRVLSLATGIDKEIPGTENGMHPFFSPDGQTLGFSSSTELKTVSLEGGIPRELGVSVVNGARGSSWGEDNTIVYAATGRSALAKININTEDVELITKLGPQETTHRWPQWLPGGGYVIFHVARNDSDTTYYDIEVVEITTQRRTLLKKDCVYGRYISSGHLLFVTAGRLYAQVFDLKKLELKGEKVVIREGIAVNGSDAAQYAVSDEGTFVYMSAGELSGVTTKLVWLDLEGNFQEASNHQELKSPFDLLADDRLVAVTRNNDIHILDLETNILRPITEGEGSYRDPVWSPDGQSIVFASHRGGLAEVWRKKVDYTSDAQLLFSLSDFRLYPSSFSEDGSVLAGSAVSTGEEGDLSVWVHSLDRTVDQPHFVSTPGISERILSLSTDGHWLVYVKDNQLYAKSTNATGAIQPLTTGGGSSPRWSKSGDRIFYSNRGAIWAIEIKAEGESIKSREPTHIVNLPSFGGHYWDISSDEKRFLVLGQDWVDVVKPADLKSVNIIFNFFTELNKLVPVDQN